MKKSCFHVYKNGYSPLQDSKYAQIFDDSMKIGSEKLVITIGNPEEHQGRLLSCADAEILDKVVAESWNGKGVANELRKASEKNGHESD